MTQILFSKDSALPTPPLSPYFLATENAMNPSLQLLTSLTMFYQQERYWTHHTRAALESVLSNSFIGKVETSMGESESEEPSDKFEGADNSNPLMDASTVKTEPSSPTQLFQTIGVERGRQTKWGLRKNNLKLRLDGIEPPIRKQARRPSQHILEMFAQLVESRMESCERVMRMVEHANRADLYKR